MGMFDSFYDKQGDEWQTKALRRNLDRHEVGDRVMGSSWTCQIEVLGGPNDGLNEGFATVRDGVLVEVPAERDVSLPLIGYGGLAQIGENDA